MPDERGRCACASAGRVYLDAVNGVGCAPLGHAHPRWVAALTAQMQRRARPANSFSTEPQRQFAAAIVARMPVVDARAFIATTGTETTEAAIKLALRATGRNTIVAFERAFHGARSARAGVHRQHRLPPPLRAASASPSRPREPFATARVLRLPFGDLDALRTAFAEHGAASPACSSSRSRARPASIRPRASSWSASIGLCREHGALVGAD